jgi:integrase
MRLQAWRILQAAYEACGLAGKLGTHAIRKTSAHGIYEKVAHDLVKTQRALRHVNINSKVAYLGYQADAEVANAILSL